MTENRQRVEYKRLTDAQKFRLSSLLQTVGEEMPDGTWRYNEGWNDERLGKEACPGVKTRVISTWRLRVKGRLYVEPQPEYEPKQSEPSPLREKVLLQERLWKRFFDIYGTEGFADLLEEPKEPQPSQMALSLENGSSVSTPSRSITATQLVFEELKQGPRSRRRLISVLKESAFTPKSVDAILSALRKNGLAENAGDMNGFRAYKLTDKGQTARASEVKR